MPASICWAIYSPGFAHLCTHTKTSADRVFNQYLQLSNFSLFVINTVLHQSDHSEVSAIFPLI